MTLTNEIKKQILDLVYIKPRTVDEVAKSIDKNWRTADRYVKQISSEEGIIGLRTFRGGTRGALKIVFWNNLDKINSSSVQQKLIKLIEIGKTKKDFSPFDIYQYVDKKRKRAFLEYREDKNEAVNQNLTGFLRSAEHQILHFSGNNSWINLIENNIKLVDTVEEIAKSGIKIKILSRVELIGLENIKKVLAINQRIGKDMIEIRHCNQPLRGFVIDDKEARFREEIDKELYQKGEFKGEKAIFYEINDPGWVSWLQKVFWNLFRQSISAEKRIKDLEDIHKMDF